MKKDQKMDIQILEDWKVRSGGSRQGSSVTVENCNLRISGDVIGWLDVDQKPCTRGKAAYAIIKRLSFPKGTEHISDEFAVPVKTDHRGVIYG